MKVKVYHASHGCETGCCGHFVEIGEEGRKQMEFTHPDLPRGDQAQVEAAKKAWAIEFAKEVIAENWPECLPTIDWETIEYDEVQEN
jgi:hypothetical protein